jgi:hypothetical protein
MNWVAGVPKGLLFMLWGFIVILGTLLAGVSKPYRHNVLLQGKEEG